MANDPVQQIDALLMNVAAPETPSSQLIQWPDPIKAGCQRFGITGVRPVAALLAQSAHESQGFTRMVENLNYSAGRMAAVWPSRFAINPHAKIPAPNALAIQLQHNPEALANHVYANRFGNGPPESGDGWRYRGEGLFQLTFKANFEEFAHAMGMTVEAVAAYCATVAGAAMSACWFFVRHGLIDLAKTPGVRDETEALNGGVVGLADRTHRFNCVVEELISRGC